MPKGAATERDIALAEIAERDAAEGTVEDGAPDVVTTSDPAEAGNDGAAERVVKDGGAEFEDNGRAELSASIAARRGKVDATNDEGEEDDEAEADAPVAATAVAGAMGSEGRKVGAPKRVNVADLDGDAVVVMKVNGKDVEVALGDIIAGRQQWEAGEAHLKEAKDIVSRAKRDALPDDTTARPATRQNQPERREAQPAADAAKTKATKDRLVAIVDRIQTGTPEDGAEALLEVLGPNADGATNQGDVRETVQHELAEAGVRNGVQAEINQAITTLRERHPALADLPSVTPGLFQAGFETMVENLRAIGVPEEDLRQPAQAIIAGYGRLRQDANWRDKLPSIGKVYDDAATRVEGELTRLGLKLPANPAPRVATQERDGRPPPVVRTREVNKTTIPVQPRSAGIRAEGSAPAATRKRDASATIAQIAAQRESGIELRR